MAVTLAVSLLSAALSLSNPPAGNDLSDEEKIYGLSRFWMEVSYNFPFFEQVPHLDWDSLYLAYIPRVLKTTSTFDYYRELQQMCALLQDGHTNIYMPPFEGLVFDRPAVKLEMFDDQLYVVNVSLSLEDQIPPGSKLLQVAGMPARKYMDTQVVPFISSSTPHVLQRVACRNLLRGQQNTQVAIEFETPQKETRTAVLTRDDALNKPQYVFPVVDIMRAPLMEYEVLDNHVAHVTINSFEPGRIMEEFDRIVPSLYDMKGVIIDLRSNGGGNGAYARHVLSYFANGDTLIGAKFRTRHNIAVEKAWGSFPPHNDFYLNQAFFESGPSVFPLDSLTPLKDMPLVILTSWQTASAAEDFLVFLHSMPGRATIIGEPTYGSSGQPMFFELPGGGRARICTKWDRFSNGEEFIGYGVKPDIEIQPSLAEVLNQEDPVLKKALSFLNNSF